MKHPRLKTHFSSLRNPEIFPRGPSALGSRSIQTAVVVAVKSVLTLQATRHLASHKTQDTHVATRTEQDSWGTCTLPQPCYRLN